MSCMEGFFFTFILIPSVYAHTIVMLLILSLRVAVFPCELTGKNGLQLLKSSFSCGDVHKLKKIYNDFFLKVDFYLSSKN